MNLRFVGFSLWMVLCITSESPAATCDSLLALSLPHTTVTLAQSVAPGAFVPPMPSGGSSLPPGAAQAFRDLPAFCRVAATLTPSPDSDIKIEVWLPLSGWNGKFEAVGNGGWAGTISYLTPGPRPASTSGATDGLAGALRRGYATASTDTGHVGSTARFALGHPEKLVDFGYRAVHEMTEKAKAITRGFYGQDPRLSYFNGCSTGGRQGLMEAQRYPDDFDGIVTGAPANPWTNGHAGAIVRSLYFAAHQAGNLPPAKRTLLEASVLSVCDAQDGVTDHLLTDPRNCRFDPATLQCPSGDGADCLTASQVEAAKAMYAPVRMKNGTIVSAGYARGSEEAYFGFGDAPRHQIRGWNDVFVAPGNTIDYYSTVVRTMGPEQDEWLRLFMAPGMGHCQGGPGPDTFDAMSAIEQWVETDKAPDSMVASHLSNGKVDRTRPLCPYPKVATYVGTGSTDSAENFICKAQ